MADKKFGITISAKADVKGDLKKVQKELEKTGKTGSKAAKQTNKEWKKTFEDMGKGASIAFVGVAAAVGTSVKVASDIEYGWAKVSTMLTSKTGPALDMMKTRLGDIAKLPTQESITGMQEAIYQLLSASVEATDVMDMMGLSLKLASAGFTTTATAADAITGVLNAYSLSTEHATHAADVLLGIQNRGKTTVGEYSRSLGMVLPTAAKLGVSFEEVGAAIATMTRQNIPARQAITSINAAMLAFITPGKEATDIAGKFGVELSLAKMQEMGFLKFLEYVNVGLGGNAELVAKATGQIEALKTMLAVTGDQFNATQKDVKGLTEEINVVAEGSEIMGDTFKEQFGAMKNQLVLLTAAFGELFLEDVKTATENVKELAAKTKEFNDKHPGLISSLVKETGAFLGLAAATGLFVKYGSKLVGPHGIMAAIMIATWSTIKSILAFRHGISDATAVIWEERLRAQKVEVDILGTAWASASTQVKLFGNALDIVIPKEDIRKVEHPPADAGAGAGISEAGIGLGIGGIEAFAEGLAERNTILGEKLEEQYTMHLEHQEKVGGIWDTAKERYEELWQEQFATVSQYMMAFSGTAHTISQSILDTEMTGRKRAELIWKSFAGSAIRALTSIALKQIAMTITDALMQKKKIVLEAAATKATVVEATIQQSAWQAVAAAKFFAAYAGIPFVGQGLALGDIATMKAAVAASRIPFHEGGMIFGGNDVPINAQGGEVIIRRDMAQQTGEVLNAINEGRIQDAARGLSEQAGVSVGQPIAVNLNVGGKLNVEDFLMIRQQIDMSLVPALREKQESGELDFLFEEDR